jgi:hypothetical protein
MENLKLILKECIEIRKELKLKVTDDLLWDTSVRIFNSQNFKEPEKKDWKNDKVTEKQLAFLKKNGYNGNDDMTKLEASILIDEVIKQGKKELLDY